MIPFGESLAVPVCDRRHRIVRIGPILLLLALPTCSDGRLDTVEPPADPAGEAGTSADGGTSAVDGGGSIASPRGEDFGAAGCFNGLDDNNDAVVDCDDQIACGGSAYCCVGTPTASCCVLPGSSITADFGTCVASDPRDCAAGPAFDWFGMSPPTLEGGAFVPNGDQRGDSGLVLGGPIDPTSQRVTMQAKIAAPVDGCSDCIDVLAFGFADPLADPMAETNVRVVPDVAVMVRASLGDVALFVAGAVVAELPLVDSEPHVYQLVTTPDGGVSVWVDGVLQVSARMTPRPGRVPLLYGRTYYPSGGVPDPARALDIAVRTTGCDIPSSLRREVSAVIPFGGVDWGARVASNPSVVREADELLVAFSLGRDVHLARVDSSGSWRLAGGGRVEAPVLTAGINEVLADPELLSADDRYVLYVTRALFDGPTTIARAEGAPAHGESFGTLVDVTLPDDATPASSPTVLDDGVLRMAIRTELDGRPVIALLEASDLAGTVFVWANSDLAGSVVVATHPDFARFDHDEVGDPELATDGGGLVRLYYAGRRGTRWGIGVRVSGDRRTWREPEDDAILAGTGAGHDSLWTRHPSVVIERGVVDLFYTASDGVTLDIGRATGRAR